MSNVGTGVEYLKRENIHSSCLDCRNYYAKGHGTIVDGNKTFYEYQELISHEKKVKLQVVRIKMNPDTGKPYPHQFKPLSPNCLGLNIKELEKRNYPWRDCDPPCWVEKE